MRSFAVYTLSRGTGVPAAAREAHQKVQELVESDRGRGVDVTVQATPIGIEGERRLCVTYADSQEAARALERVRAIVQGVDLVNVVVEPCTPPPVESSNKGEAVMRSLLLVVCLLVLVSLSACRNEQPSETPATPPATPPRSDVVPPPEIKRIQATPEAVAKADEALEAAAERARKMRAALTFDEFKATVFREPFEGGKYIVNGDTVIANDKQLLEFYEQNVKASQGRAELTLAVEAGLDAKWNQQAKTQLTYCVSNTFGSRHAAVVQQMAKCDRSVGEGRGRRFHARPGAGRNVHGVESRTSSSTCGR